jgi:hypothetical protein
MNVDILKDNPDWRLYIPIVGASLTLTIIVWLVFKYNPVRLLSQCRFGNTDEKYRLKHGLKNLLLLSLRNGRVNMGYSPLEFTTRRKTWEKRKEII